MWPSSACETYTRNMYGHVHKQTIGTEARDITSPQTYSNSRYLQSITGEYVLVGLN